MNIRLGINTGFAINRYPMPEQWMRIVRQECGIGHVQLTADLINPCLGKDIIDDLVKRINSCKKKYNVSIDSLMTGAYTRVNHFSHPDLCVRQYWNKWFRDLADIAVRIGAKNLSSHLGILCADDLHNQKRREFLLNETIKSWKGLAKYGYDIGLKSLSWEPMSIRREYGETINETIRIQKMLSSSAIPITLCIDVNHGDTTSTNKCDYDYKKWLSVFAKSISFVHIKQFQEDRFNHYPFIEKYNAKGSVNPQKVINSIRYGLAADASDSAGAIDSRNITLLLEIAFKEREPVDSTVLQCLKESADYWKRGLKAYGT